MTTGLRTRVKALCPPWLREGVGERLLYGFGLACDGLLDKLTQGIQARMPTRARADAQNLIGQDRLIPRGLTESDESYGERLQKAFETWQLAGTARAVLGQARGLLLSFAPRMLLVSSQYALDPARLEAQIYKTRGLKVTAATNATPIAVTTSIAHGWSTGNVVRVVGSGGNTAANGQWTITVTSTTSFTLQTSVGNGPYSGGARVSLVADLPSVSYPPERLSSTWDLYANDRPTTVEPVHVFVTDSGGNFDWDSVSQVDDSYRAGDGVLVIYATDDVWCTPPIWMIGDFYSIDTLPGSIGLSVDAEVIDAIRSAVGRFKNALSSIRWIVVSFDNALFDPYLPAALDNPDGTFGTWSRVDSGTYVATRFPNAEYCAGTE